MERNAFSFIGCGASYEDAKTVLFGAPFDSTTSFRPGARFACSAMRTESIGIETYSPYQDGDLDDLSVFDAGDLELPFGNAERSLCVIENFCAGVLGDGKTPAMIGGEHLVTLGAVRAAVSRHPGLSVFHFDAHADFRGDYMGESLSHATVMRRVWDLLGDGKIFQFGIRSGDRDEFDRARGHVKTERFKAETVKDRAAEAAGGPVYVTVDLDVLDPSEFPGTGTPEAGGLSFTELLAAILGLSGSKIVGFDICELSPHYDHSGISTAVACKTLREMLIAFSGRAL
ncbi:MAG: agmatinase [Synergistaceae bacterium]|nr:agmatinase [Synergistaceae bacterium]